MASGEGLEILAGQSRLRGLTPKIKSTLALCRDLLSRNLPDQEQAKGDIGVYDNHWSFVVPFEYGMDTWEEFEDSPFLVHTQPQIYSFLQDSLLPLLKGGEPTRPIDLVSLVKVVILPDQFGQTAWHRFVVRDVIRAFMEKPKQLSWEAWCTKVDLCAELLQSAELFGADMDDLGDEHGIFKSEVRLPPTSAEHWAWEFGRVAAMWPMVDKTVVEDNFGSEYFDGWDNGLSALSLISAAQEPGDILVDRCWLGAFATWRSSPESEPDLIRMGEPTYPAFQLANDHLFWLMRLGYLDGVKRIGQRERQETTVDPSESDVLLLGPSKQIGRALLDLLAEAEQERANLIKNELVERLRRLMEDGAGAAEKESRLHETGDSGERLDLSDWIFRDPVEKVLFSLSSREAQVIKLRFGIGGEHPQTLEQVGQHVVALFKAPGGFWPV